MSEMAYEQMEEEVSKEDIGPIRRIGNSMDQSLDVLEKSIARLQARLQPILRETDQVRAVPSSLDKDGAESPFARSYQEQVRRIDVMTARVQELASDCTI